MGDILSPPQSEYNGIDSAWGRYVPEDGANRRDILCFTGTSWLQVDWHIDYWLHYLFTKIHIYDIRLQKHIIIRTRELRNKGKGVVHYNVKKWLAITSECVVYHHVVCDREELWVWKIYTIPKFGKREKSRKGCLQLHKWMKPRLLIYSTCYFITVT